MRKVTLGECGLDTLTLALAYVYFEMVIHYHIQSLSNLCSKSNDFSLQLVLKMVVNKTNRKCLAGACLILAAKLNDVKGTNLTFFLEVTSNQLSM
jgi:hypothetical protein